MSFVAKLKVSGANPVYLVQGMDKGRPAWYYLKVEKNKVPLFEGEVRKNRGSIELEYYGEVLEYGWGEQPPENIRNKFIKNNS